MYNTALLQQSYILSSAFASIGASNSVYKKHPFTASIAIPWAYHALQVKTVTIATQTRISNN